MNGKTLDKIAPDAAELAAGIISQMSCIPDLLREKVRLPLTHQIESQLPFELYEHIGEQTWDLTAERTNNFSLDGMWSSPPRGLAP